MGVIASGNALGGSAPTSFPKGKAAPREYLWNEEGARNASLTNRALVSWHGTGWEADDRERGRPPVFNWGLTLNSSFFKYPS